MVTRNGKRSGTRLALVGLYAVLTLPLFVDVSAAACRTAPAREAARSEPNREERATTDAEYLRLHRAVTAPAQFRDLDPVADQDGLGNDRRAARDRTGARCNWVERQPARHFVDVYHATFGRS